MNPVAVADSGDGLGTMRSTELELFSLAGHDGFLREVNEAFAGLLGMTSAQINGRSLLELVDPGDLGDVVAGLAALEAGAAEVAFDCQFRHRDGRDIFLQWIARPLAGGDLWWAAGRDTTAFHRLLVEQADLQTRLGLIVGHAAAAMWELDMPRGDLSWEPQAADVLGVVVEALPVTVGELTTFVHPNDAAPLADAMRELGVTGTMRAEVRIGAEPGLRHLSLRGKLLDRDHRGRPRRAIGVLLDISSEKAMEEQMMRMVMTDSLTGVPNRRAFDRTLRGEWHRCARAKQPLSIVMVDIDNFKQFNDVFGHLVGDAALCAVARALPATLRREGDLLARFGGEEFAVVLPDTDAAAASRIAGWLVDAVRGVTLRQADHANLTVSVGTATCDIANAAMKPDELLRQADEALYAAKAAGKDRVMAYETFLAARALLEGEIARGLLENEFELMYQPIVALATGDVVAFEALARWNRPGFGMQSPDAFISTAERSSLICHLGRWALREAACRLEAWSRAGLDEHAAIRVTVNVSARHAGSPSILDDVSAALAASGLTPARLEIELTETTFPDDTLTAKHLERIRALGVRVALDDFGTGQTSIAQLPRLAVDALKIDRRFVASPEPREQKLVALMIEAAHAFDLTVVAEGVEEPETLASLRALGCDTVQGFLIGRPMAAEQVAPWLRARRAAGESQPSARDD